MPELTIEELRKIIKELNLLRLGLRKATLAIVAIENQIMGTVGDGDELGQKFDTWTIYDNEGYCALNPIEPRVQADHTYMIRNEREQPAVFHTGDCVFVFDPNHMTKRPDGEIEISFDPLEPIDVSTLTKEQIKVPKTYYWLSCANPAEKGGGESPGDVFIDPPVGP